MQVVLAWTKLQWRRNGPPWLCHTYGCRFYFYRYPWRRQFVCSKERKKKNLKLKSICTEALCPERPSQNPDCSRAWGLHQCFLNLPSLCYTKTRVWGRRQSGWKDSAGRLIWEVSTRLSWGGRVFNRIEQVYDCAKLLVRFHSINELTPYEEWLYNFSVRLANQLRSWETSCHMNIQFSPATSGATAILGNNLTQCRVFISTMKLMFPYGSCLNPGYTQTIWILKPFTNGS